MTIALWLWPVIGAPVNRPRTEETTPLRPVLRADDPDPERPVPAMQKISDPSVLARLAVENPDAAVRMTAVSRLKDRSALQGRCQGAAGDIAQRRCRVAKLVLAACSQDFPPARRPLLLRQLFVVAEQLSEPAVAAGYGSLQQLELRASEEGVEYRNEYGNHETLWGRAERLDARAMFEGHPTPVVDSVRADVPERISAGGSLADRTWTAYFHSWALVQVLVQQLGPETLATLATEAESPNLRGLAAARLVDDSVLIRISSTDPSRLVRDAARQVRLKALEASRDGSHLASLATGDLDPSVRRAAVAKVEDQSVLAIVAEKDTDATVRRAAVTRVEDQAVRAKLALKDPDAEVRRLALASVLDQDTLATAAVRDRDSEARVAAVIGVTDPPLLLKIARTDPAQDVRRAAIWGYLNARPPIGPDPTFAASQAGKPPSVRIVKLVTYRGEERLSGSPMFIYFRDLQGAGRTCTPGKTWDGRPAFIEPLELAPGEGVFGARLDFMKDASHWRVAHARMLHEVAFAGLPGGILIDWNLLSERQLPLNAMKDLLPGSATSD